MNIPEIMIRKVTTQDTAAIWRIIHEVIQTGETYTFAPDTPESVVMSYWLGKDKHTYVSTNVQNMVVGTYMLKDNHPGLGSHVANVSFMVAPDHHGKGIGKAMALHAIEEAQKIGYRAIQANMVVSTNTNAIHLWKKLGWKTIGTIPKAFNHKKKGFVDALIMHRFI